MHVSFLPNSRQGRDSRTRLSKHPHSAAHSTHTGLSPTYPAATCAFYTLFTRVFLNAIYTGFLAQKIGQSLCGSGPYIFDGINKKLKIIIKKKVPFSCAANWNLSVGAGRAWGGGGGGGGAGAGVLLGRFMAKESPSIRGQLAR